MWIRELSRMVLLLKIFKMSAIQWRVRLDNRGMGGLKFWKAGTELF